MVGIIQELQYHQKVLLSTAVTFFKLVQISNFGRLNSANEHILPRLFPNLRQIPKLHLAYMVGIIQEHTTKKVCPPLQCIICKLVQMSNFGRLKSQNGHFQIYYFQIKGKSLTSILRVWWPLIRSSITTKRFCSLQCSAVQCSTFSVNWCKCAIFVGSILQMSTFWRDYFQI